MDYPTISYQLITSDVMDQIRYDQSKFDVTPAQAVKTIQFARSPFYDLYGDHWNDFLELREKAITCFNSPDHLKLEHDQVIFGMSTNAVTPESLAILKVYFGGLGWETMVVNRTGMIAFKYDGKFSSASTYEFKLTPKRGQLE